MLSVVKRLIGLNAVRFTILHFNIWTDIEFFLYFVCFLCRQVPTASVTIEGASALNRVRWSSGGKEVAVGDSEGRVWIYDTGEVQMTVVCC